MFSTPAKMVLPSLCVHESKALHLTKSSSRFSVLVIITRSAALGPDLYFLLWRGNITLLLFSSCLTGHSFSILNSQRWHILSLDHSLFSNYNAIPCWLWLYLPSDTCGSEPTLQPSPFPLIHPALGSTPFSCVDIDLIFLSV